MLDQEFMLFCVHRTKYLLKNPFIPKELCKPFFVILVFRGKSDSPICFAMHLASASLWALLDQYIRDTGRTPLPQIHLDNRCQWLSITGNKLLYVTKVIEHNDDVTISVPKTIEQVTDSVSLV